MRGIEVGRIAKDDASWLAKLMDRALITVEGYCAHAEENFKSGASSIFLRLPISFRDRTKKGS